MQRMSSRLQTNLAVKDRQRPHVSMKGTSVSPSRLARTSSIRKSWRWLQRPGTTSSSEAASRYLLLYVSCRLFAHLPANYSWRLQIFGSDGDRGVGEAYFLTTFGKIPGERIR
jgi:hypothetical protein